MDKLNLHMYYTINYFLGAWGDCNCYRYDCFMCTNSHI